MSTEYEIMEQQLAKCKTLLTSKNKEYSDGKAFRQWTRNEQS